MFGLWDKIRETRLRWFEHVQHKPATESVRKSLAMKVNGPQRERDRPKRMWMEVVNIDMKYNLSEDLTQDRSERRNKIHVANPNIVRIRV